MKNQTWRAVRHDWTAMDCETEVRLRDFFTAMS